MECGRITNCFTCLFHHTKLKRLLCALLTLGITCAISANAVAAIYWDTNSSAPGAGTTPSGIWSSTASNWTTDNTGNSGTFAYSTDDVIFSADAGSPTSSSNPFVVTVSDLVAANSVTFGEAGGTTASATISGGTLSLLGNSVNVNVGATINSIIVGSSGLYKSGAGSLAIGSAGNAWSGGTTIDYATLQVTANGALSSVSALNVQAGSGFAELDMSNTLQNVGSLQGGSRGFVNLGTSGSLTVGSDDSNTNFQGQLVGGSGASFTMTGAGSLNFGNAQPFNYSGQLNIASGTVSITSDFGLPSTASLNVSAAGTLYLQGCNSAIGSIGGAGSIFDNNGGNNFLAVGVNNSSTTFSGTIVGMRLNKLGSGMLTLTSAGSSPSSVNVNGGTLALAGNGELNGITPNVYHGGTVLWDNSSMDDTARLSGISLNGGALVYRTNAAGDSQTLPLALGSGDSTIVIDAAASTSGGFNGISATSMPSINNGSTLVVTGQSLGSAPAPGVATFTVDQFNGLGGGGSNGTPTMSIRPDILADTTLSGPGAGFAVQDSATGYIRPLSLAAGEYAVSVGTADNQANLLISGATQSISSETLINSLTLGSGGGIGGSGQLDIGSGGILALPGNLGISVTNLPTFRGGNGYNFWTLGDLTVNSFLNGNSSLTKSGSGNLTLEKPYALGGSLWVNSGTVTLNSGGFFNQDNPIFLNVWNGGPTQTTGYNVFDLEMNGGTLDLFGHNQWVGTVNGSDNPNAIGTISNSSGTATLMAIFFGRNISLSDSGSGTLNFVNWAGNNGTTYVFAANSPMHGSFTWTGGKGYLMDSGMLPNISALNLDSTSFFALENSPFTANGGPGEDGLAANINDRVNPSAALNLNGGWLYLDGAPDATSTQTFSGTTSLIQGTSTVQAGANGAGVAILTLNQMVRSSGATVRFAGGGSALYDSLGVPQVGVSQIQVNNVGGVATASTLSNGILGAWATVGYNGNGNDWATYSPTAGIVGLNSGAGYSANSLANGGPTDNIMVNATITGITSRSVNTININGGYALTMSSTGSVLATGGIINTDGNSYFNGGSLTSTGSELFLWNSGNSGGGQDLIVNGHIVNNGATPVALVKSGEANLYLNNSNTYTGGTYVNNGLGGNYPALYLNGYAAGVQTLGTGGLTITSATVVENNFAGQLGTSNTVSLNGSAILNLIGNNTIAGLNVNANASDHAPRFYINNSLANAPGVLTLNGDINAVNNQGTTETFNLGSYNSLNYIDFGGQTRNVAVSGQAIIGMGLSAVLIDGGFNKTGPGMLVLDNSLGINSYAGPTIVSEGTLKLEYANVVSPYSAVSVAAGASIDLSGWYGNNQQQAFGSLSGAGVVNDFTTQNAPVALTVGYDGTSTTFSGAIQGNPFPGLNDSTVTSLIKVGTGTLTLTGSGNNYTGTTTVQQGTLALAGNGVLAAPNGNNNAQLTILDGAFAFDNTTTNNPARISGDPTQFGVTMGGGMLSLLGMSGGTSSQSVGTLTLGARASTINVVNGASGASATTLTLNGLNRSQGATLNFTSGGNGNLGAGGNSPQVNFNDQSFGTVLDYATVSGASFAVYGANGIQSMADGGVSPQSYQYVTTSEAGTSLTGGAYNRVDETVSNIPDGLSVTGLMLNADRALNLLSTSTLTIGNPSTSIAGIIKSTTGDTSFITGGVLQVVNGGELVVSVPNDFGGMEIDSTIAGGALTKTGAGALVLGSANTYTDMTTINAGTLRLAVAGAINAGNSLVVNGAAASFDLAGNDQVLGNTTVLSGNIVDSASTATLTVAGLNLGGGPSGSTAMVNVHRLVLNGDVNYDGTNNPQTAILAGTTDLGGATRTFNVGASSAPGATVSLDITGIITGDTGDGIQVSNFNGSNGNLRLSGANTFDGPVVVFSGAALTLANSQALGLPSSPTTTTIQNGGELLISVSLSNTNNQISLSGGGFANYALALYPAALVNTSGSNTIAGQVSVADGTTISVIHAGDQLTLENLQAAGGTITLTKDGLGTLKIAGGGYDGMIQVNRGTVALTNSALGPTSNWPLGVSAGATILLDGASGNVTLGVNNPLSLTGGGVGIGVGPGAAYGSGFGGALDSRGADNAVNGEVSLNGPTTITSQTPGNSLTISGDISGGNPLTIDGAGDVVLNGMFNAGSNGALNKAGNGTTTLGAANSYNDATNVLGGTLKLGVDNAIPTTSPVTLANTLTCGTAAIDLAGHNQTLANSLNFGGNYVVPGSTGQIVDSVGGGTLFLDTDTLPTVSVAGGSHLISANVEIDNANLTVNAVSNGQLTISGDLSDDGGARSLTLDGDGSGLLILSGTNNYGGGTTVSNGTLILTNNEALVDGSSLTVGDALAFAPAAVVPANTVAAGSGLSAPAIAAVPEPGTLALLAAGGVLLATFRKRRKL